MADLNEQVMTVTRKKWDRANKVRIENEHGKTPKVVFEVQTITTDDGVVVGTVPKSIVTVEFDPTAVYPLINPLDDSVIDPTGGNHFAVQVQLYSLFKSRVSWE